MMAEIAGPGSSKKHFTSSQIKAMKKKMQKSFSKIPKIQKLSSQDQKKASIEAERILSQSL